MAGKAGKIARTYTTFPILTECDYSNAFSAAQLLLGRSNHYSLPTTHYPLITAQISKDL